MVYASLLVELARFKVKTNQILDLLRYFLIVDEVIVSICNEAAAWSVEVSIEYDEAVLVMAEEIEAIAPAVEVFPKITSDVDVWKLFVLESFEMVQQVLC